MTRKWGKQQEYDPSISARIPREHKEELAKRFPNDGDVSKLLRALIKRYLAGKIIGVQIEES
jgi:hypothetical protein